MTVRNPRIWVLLVGVLVVFLYLWDNPPQQLAFDKSVWEQEGDKLKWNKRYYMIPDLLKRRMLEGMKRKDAITLLGEPDLILNDRIEYSLGAIGSDSAHATLTLVCNSDKVEEVIVTRNR